MLENEPRDVLWSLDRCQVRNAVEDDQPAVRHLVGDLLKARRRGDGVLGTGDREHRYGDLGEPVTHVEDRERLADREIPLVGGLGQRVEQGTGTFRLPRDEPRPNQRREEGPTITDVPPRRTRSMRSCQDSGVPSRAPLHKMTRERSRSGASSAIWSPTAPPTESPA